MGYRIVYTHRALKDIQRLDPHVKQRLRATLERYCESPFDYATRLASPELGTYRFRIGDYRVIFDVRGTDLVVLRIGHRRDIYRGT